MHSDRKQMSSHQGLVWQEIGVTADEPGASSGEWWQHHSEYDGKSRIMFLKFTVWMYKEVWIEKKVSIDLRNGSAGKGHTPHTHTRTHHTHMHTHAYNTLTHTHTIHVLTHAHTHHTNSHMHTHTTYSHMYTHKPGDLRSILNPC